MMDDDARTVANELGIHVERLVKHPESFGSWYMLLAVAGEAYRLIWDGREGQLMLQRGTDQKHQDIAIRASATTEHMRDLLARIANSES